MSEERKVEVTGLSSIIDSLKSELGNCRKTSQNTMETPKLYLRQVKLDLVMTAEESLEAGGAISLKLFSLNAKEKVGTKNCHTVSLEFDVEDDGATYNKR